MNTPTKLHGLLGMAKRAGKLSVGFDAAKGAVENGKCGLVLIAADGSPKTEKECRFIAETYQTQVLRLPLDKAAFAAAIGSAKPVVVLAVCDSGFAKAIRLSIDELKEETSL